VPSSDRFKPNYHSRPQSIQRSSEELGQVQPPSYNAGSSRADQSALDHIRRIRRNMPSQQSSRMMHRELSVDYISSHQLNGNSNNNKIENYKRIK